MKYKQILVKVTHDEADLAALAMIEAGSEGAAVHDGREIAEFLAQGGGWDYVDDAIAAELPFDEVVVAGGFPECFDTSDLSDRLSGYLGRTPELICSVCDSLDWENEWKKYYRPIDFGALIVVPSWLDEEYSRPKVLIDPGMAFGTGSHETTGMCIHLMSGQELSGKKAVDIGCGSGILGLSALRLGAKSCAFIDFDPLAIQATKANLALNGLNGELICGSLTDGFEGKADIVFANLTADILLRLLPELPAITKKGSLVIISGIINSRGGEVLSAFTKEATKLIKQEKQGEWQAFLLEVL